LKTRVFKDFYRLYPEKFLNITNGVTQRRWLLHANPELARYISLLIGDDWILDFSQIAKLHDFAGRPECQEEFLTIKRKNKARLIDHINSEVRMHVDEEQFGIVSSPLLDINSIFDVQIKRLHEYKRQLMNVLHAIALYQEMVHNPDHKRCKRTIIFGGKAAPGYEMAKNIIRLIYCVARKVNRDPSIEGMLNILYVENYNVSLAEVIIPAAEVSEQISLAGMEASGTGNMKLAINGALTVGTNDGANIEMREAVTDQWWPFSFGASADEVEKLKGSHSYRSREFYNSNLKLRLAVDALHDRSFAINDSEHRAFCSIYDALIQEDYYMLLYDFQSYCNVQLKVEKLYCQPLLWAEYALHNIAAMGSFSSDAAIDRYCKNVWNLKPVSASAEILEAVRHEYSVLDVCRVYK